MKKTPLDKIKKEEDYQSLMGIYHTAQSAAAVIIDIIAMMNKDIAHLVQDNYLNLDFLIKEAIIKSDIKNSLKEIIGLRNRLAHEYNGIIDNLAWETISNNLKNLEVFHDVIEEWLSKQI